MRQIDAYTQSRFGREAVSVCTCWRLTRRDGVEIGLTDHDEDVAFGGTVFLRGGGDARALRATADLGADDSEVIGVLDDMRIARRDLLAGLWDGARVEVWRADWEDPSARLLMRTGTIGEVMLDDGRFTAAFVSLKQTLSARIGRVYSRRCDAVLGDARCGVDLTDPALFADVTLGEAAERVFAVQGAEGFASGFFSGGAVLVTNGPFAGVVRGIREHGSAPSGVTLSLWQAFPETLQAGTALRLTAGCDKRFATCRSRFGNGLNFRGHPHMPGNDMLTATPSPGGERV